MKATLDLVPELPRLPVVIRALSCQLVLRQGERAFLDDGVEPEAELLPAPRAPDQHGQAHVRAFRDRGSGIPPSQTAA